jgi:hypothetical protein
MTVTVYVLVFWILSGPAGGPAVVDNIASKAACELLLTQIKDRVTSGRCYAIEKIIKQ